MEPKSLFWRERLDASTKTRGRGNTLFVNSNQPVLALAASAMLSTGMISDSDAIHEWLLPALGLDPQRFVLRMPADRTRTWQRSRLAW
jgi:hypothetical protein